jgi:hypothetical protein
MRRYTKEPPEDFDTFVPCSIQSLDTRPAGSRQDSRKRRKSAAKVNDLDSKLKSSIGNPGCLARGLVAFNGTSSSGEDVGESDFLLN